jgi:predicted GTPase
VPDLIEEALNSIADAIHRNMDGDIIVLNREDLLTVMEHFLEESLQMEAYEQASAREDLKDRGLL